MNFQKATHIFFFLLLILIPIAYSEAIQESSMLPKYLLLSGLLVVSLSFFFKRITKTALAISLSTLLVIAYFLLAIISSWGAINFSDALFASSKIMLFATTFFLSTFLLKNSTDKTFKIISTFSLIAIVIAVLFMLKEFTQAIQSKEPLSSTIYLVRGLHGHKNLLSAWFMLLLPLSLIGYSAKSMFSSFWRLSISILALVMILLLQARAAYTGLAIGVLIFAFMHYAAKCKNTLALIRNLFSIIIGIAFLTILLILFSPVIENYLTSISLESASANERLVLWKKTIGLIKQNSFWGIGGENWKFLFPTQGLDGLYRAELNNVAYIRPHNDFLWIWSEYGLLGLLSFLGFLFTILWNGIKSIGTKAEGWRLTAIATAAVFAYLGMSFFDFPKERMEHQVALAILLAIIVSKSKNQQILVLNPKFSKPLILMGIIGLAYFSHYAFERYQSEIHITKILTLKEKGEHQQIIEQAGKVNQTYIQVDNNGVPISWYLGNALFNLGRQKEAAVRFLEAVQVNPNSFNVLNNAGVAYVLNNQPALAEEYFLAALKINPKHDDSRLNLAAVYINQSKWELAAQALNEIHAKSQRSEELRRMVENNR